MSVKTTSCKLFLGLDQSSGPTESSVSMYEWEDRVMVVYADRAGHTHCLQSKSTRFLLVHKASVNSSD